MPIRSIAPPLERAAGALPLAERAAPPTLTVVRIPGAEADPVRVARLAELHAALGQAVRELEYTLRRTTTVDGAPDRPAATDQAIEAVARVAFAGREERRQRADRMSRYVVLIAETAGTALTARDLRLAVVLHELGRTALPDDLVTVPGSADRLDGRGAPTSAVQDAAAIGVASHEWWDGSGYPRGLRGDEIPLVARLASVARAFEDLTTSRTGEGGVAHDEVLTIMRDRRGRQLDPRLLDAFLVAADRVWAIRTAAPAAAPASAGRAGPRSSDRSRSAIRPVGASLTPRELQVLELVAVGIPNKQIAQELGLRLNTVRNHVQNVLCKLQSHSKMEAVATAVRDRLIAYPGG